MAEVADVVEPAVVIPRGQDALHGKHPQSAQNCDEHVWSACHCKGRGGVKGMHASMQSDPRQGRGGVDCALTSIALKRQQWSYVPVNMKGMHAYMQLHIDTC